jgi:hypothetical protein
MNQRATVSGWRLLELELPVEAGSFIPARSHGRETAERKVGRSYSPQARKMSRSRSDSHQVGVHVYEKPC